MKSAPSSVRTALKEVPAMTRGYERYRRMGGIINENDYRSALGRLNGAVMLTAALIRQAENISRSAGIVLASASDPRVVLYAILRNDVRPDDVQHHHSQMCDQRLFAEALRMLGDEESLIKLVAAFPNISFD